MSSDSAEHVRDRLIQFAAGRFVLASLSILYGVATSLRNTLYDHSLLGSHSVPLPVVSIGNLTAGGNAKTPLSIFLAEAFRELGYHPVVLTRGYGGNERGPLKVESFHDASDVGDEPLMLASRYDLPVVVARDRVAGARHILDRQIGDLILLDDGMQHRRLSRDLDIVSVNVDSCESIDRFFQAKLLPLGNFREQLKRGMARAQVVVLSSRSHQFIEKDVLERITSKLPDGVEVFCSRYAPAPPEKVDGTGSLSQQKVVAFTGIANPDGFYQTLESVGYVLVQKRSFPDHYQFTPDDLKQLQQEAGDHPLVCTEKDAVRLKGMDMDLSAFCFLPVQLEIDRSKRFLELVSGSLKRAEVLE